MRDEWEGKVKRMIQIFCILSCFCLFEKFCHFVDPWNAGSLTSHSLWIPCWKLSFLSRMTHSNYQQHALSLSLLYAPKTSVLDLSSDVIWSPNFLVVLKISFCFFFPQKKTELSDSLPPQLSPPKSTHFSSSLFLFSLPLLISLPLSG